MKRIAVLGTGLVGSLIVRDLASDPGLSVLAVDHSEEALDRLATRAPIDRRKADLSDAASIREVIRGADAVVGAVPGRLGFNMLRTVIESGLPIADISFSPEDPLPLDSLARETGSTAIVDCGVSPGLSNLAVGRAASRLDTIDDAVIYVGGLPVERRWPYEYVVVFSATDVIEEYTRPARLVADGRIVVRPALSEVELVDIAPIGTLEAFNSDGLRTLLHTVKANNMKEKTLRYPGHADRMRMLRETGFFSDEPVDIGGESIAPRQLTEKLLFRSWKRPEGGRELTVLRVVVRGGGQIAEFDLYDETDASTGETSMARTTGFPCAILARMLAEGVVKGGGVRPLEALGRDDAAYDRLVAELRRRNVDFRETFRAASDQSA